ncbi:MAG: hypothetical protein HFJ29_09225 [Clostridia bacterium]|nr:hypothetical protein [Clostridia bacterium]
MIKNQIPKKVQEALNQHDNHIRETYFKENIIQTVIDKEIICGYDKLKKIN